MESGVATYCARGQVPHSTLSRHRSAAPCYAPSFSPSLKNSCLKSSSLFGESLRVTSKSLPRISKAAALVTKCEIGDSLEEFLAKATPDKNLIRLLMSMGEALRTISYKVRTASCGGTACVNSFGDEQLAVDMLADKLLFEALTYSHVCKYACSEEVPELQDMGGPVEDRQYKILDGGFASRICQDLYGSDCNIMEIQPSTFIQSRIKTGVATVPTASKHRIFKEDIPTI